MPDVTEPLQGTERAVVRGLQVALIGGLLAGWYIAGASRLVSSLMLPPMPDVALRFVQIVRAGGFWDDLAVTFQEIFWSFVISAALGIAVGFVASRRRIDVEVFEPILAGLYAVPIIIVYPLYVLLFGLGIGSKIALGATTAFFPIALSTMSGFAGVSRVYLDAARVMGASRWKLFRHVLLPASLPMMLAGLRVGFIIAYLSIIGGEMLASYRGIGRLIIAQAEAMNSGRMYAYIVFLVILSLLMNGLLSALESRLGGRKQ